MTMFARRSLRSFLNALDSTLTRCQLQALINRLNLNDRDSVAAEWEVAILYALMNLGDVTYEPKMVGKSNPDILFTPSQHKPEQFIADVTFVSDLDLEEKNPIFELSQLVAAKARKLRIPGAFSCAPESTTRGRYGAFKVQLSIPHKRNLSAFVEADIVPHLRLIAKTPDKPSEIRIISSGYNITLCYAPGNRFSFSKFRAYRHATIIDKNPLFRALESKRQQLRDTKYEGCKGIIVCDGGCETITKRYASWESYSKLQIITRFFQNTSSISFVILLWVEQIDDINNPRRHRVMGDIVINPHARFPVPKELEELLKGLPWHWPQPVQTGERTRAQLEGYGPKNAQLHWGRRLGGYQMGFGHSSRLTFRMSARELMEILSGRRSHEIFEDDAGFGAANRGGPMNPFESALRRGLTISSVKIERNSDLDDDWIEFLMEGPDVAIGPFQAPSAKPK
jgi:hypothetical protein